MIAACLEVEEAQFTDKKGRSREQIYSLIIFKTFRKKFSGFPDRKKI